MYMKIALCQLVFLVALSAQKSPLSIGSTALRQPSVVPVAQKSFTEILNEAYKAKPVQVINNNSTAYDLVVKVAKDLAYQSSKYRGCSTDTDSISNCFAQFSYDLYKQVSYTLDLKSDANLLALAGLSRSYFGWISTAPQYNLDFDLGDLFIAVLA